MAPLYAILFVASMAVINVPGAQSSTSSSPTGTSGYIGCYRDGNPRIMGTQRYGYESVMTAEACSLLCDGYDYFGTQYGSQCFCGDASTEFDIYCGDTNCDDVVCDTPCNGDSNEICGGRWAMSVYETTDVAQTCGNGVPGIIGSDADGFAACCPLSCSSCDYECGAGDSDCCPGTILTTQELCSVSATAPCALYDPCEVGPCEDGTECHAVALGGSDPLEAVCVPVGCTVEFPQYIGNGECDSVEDGYNTEACGYDGGDCCEQTCTPAPTSTCGDFNCLDPDYAIDLDYSKLGCAEDPNPGPDGGRLLSVGPFQADSMSAEICYGICGVELPGFEYFGTQWSSECFCATALRDEVSFEPEHDGCDYTCAGSIDDEICGGRDAVTVYQIDEVVEPDIYSELGCAEDPNPGPDGGRLLSVGPFQADPMSAEICYGICGVELPGFEYFGTQWSSECFCATALRDEVSFEPEHDGCDYPCAGSTDDEICGGRDAVTVYQVEDVVEPDIYEEVGCAEDPNPGDDGGRLMPVGPIQRDTMSAEICYGLCEEELPGFTYFGTQWSIECWCSQDPPNVSSDPSHDGCIDVCAGSTDGEICGGTDALTIYYVIGSE